MQKTKTAYFRKNVRFLIAWIRCWLKQMFNFTLKLGIHKGLDLHNLIFCTEDTENQWYDSWPYHGYHEAFWCSSQKYKGVYNLRCFALTWSPGAFNKYRLFRLSAFLWVERHTGGLAEHLQEHLVLWRRHCPIFLLLEEFRHFQQQKSHNYLSSL